MAGILYMLPVTLGAETTSNTIPADVAALAVQLRFFAVEDVKSARRFLRKLDREFPIDECEFLVVNKRTTAAELKPILRWLQAGNNVGVMSDAGCPGIADPGSAVAALAHENNIRLSPLVGPSSILLTLIGSGFNGQQFTFHGYLPKESRDRIRKLKDLEARVRRTGETQLFMDTPFRNMHVLEDMLNELSDDTLICIAMNLTLPTERIQTMTVANWREKAFDLAKNPVMFAIGRSL